MNRRLLLGLIGLSPLALIASKVPTEDALVAILINRWKKSKAYTLAVLEAMPEDKLEFSPSMAQMSFAQHFLHLGFTNNTFIGILIDAKTYPDFNALKNAEFLLELSDPINIFQPDALAKRGSKENKALVSEYVTATFDYVISSLTTLSDAALASGIEKEKPWYLEGHSNLDMILRSESHTAHHRAQAICYLRMNGIQPPGYSKNNTL